MTATPPSSRQSVPSNPKTAVLDGQEAPVGPHVR